MNILPKKRWHVRTKENIARVRKDEAEAAEKERQEQKRIEQADRELRISILKQKSKEKLEGLNISNEKRDDIITNDKLEHINLFSHIEHSVSTTNKEHDKEEKEKKEEYEKKIGYLTYLGQDTNEALGKKNWYNLAPGSLQFTRPAYVKDTYEKLVLNDIDGKPKKKDIDVKDGEIGWKSKQQHDPYNLFKHIHSNRDSLKKNKLTFKDTKTIRNSKYTNKSDKEAKLQKLREARLKREQQEKCKADLFLARLSGIQTHEKRDERPKVVPKYNSQFNPGLARQNYK